MGDLLMTTKGYIVATRYEYEIESLGCIYRSLDEADAAILDDIRDNWSSCPAETADEGLSWLLAEGIPADYVTSEVDMPTPSDIFDEVRVMSGRSPTDPTVAQVRIGAEQWAVTGAGASQAIYDRMTKNGNRMTVLLMLPAYMHDDQPTPSDCIQRVWVDGSSEDIDAAIEAARVQAAADLGWEEDPEYMQDLTPVAVYAGERFDLFQP